MEKIIDTQDLTPTTIDRVRQKWKELTANTPIFNEYVDDFDKFFTEYYISIPAQSIHEYLSDYYEWMDEHNIDEFDNRRVEEIKSEGKEKFIEKYSERMDVFEHVARDDGYIVMDGHEPTLYIAKE